jgi:hypothetical protein
MQLAALALAALASAGAAPPSPPDVPLGAFPDYSHPEITADNCSAKDAAHTICYIPAKTMGRYVVDVRVRATANGAGATQAVAIGGPGWGCGEAKTKATDWSSGSRTFVARCFITVLNDTPVELIATAGGDNITLDPKGPVVTLRRLAWNGILDTQGFQAALAKPAADTGK